MEELSNELNANSFSSQMKNLVLDGWIRFGKFYIVRDCTKNYLHLTIEPAALESEPTDVMTLQLSVDNKTIPGETREVEQLAQQEMPKSTQQRIYEWAYQLWYGDSVTEYSVTDLQDEQLVKQIIFKFVEILRSPSWDEEFKSLHSTSATTETALQGTT